MPIKVPNNLPAVDTLTKENVFVMTDARAMTQDIRPLHILLLNLMPTKIETETQLTRLLGNTPLQIELELLQTSTHKAHNVSQEHMLAFYKTFHEIRNNYYDGMIITGAPVELMEFEEVEYWDELCEIMEWSKSHVHSTFHICWGAQAALYYHYGIPKHVLPKKLSGVYEHHLDYKNGMLFRGFDDVFYVPHSRNTTVNREDIEAVSELKVIASSPEAGVFAVKSENDRQIFVMGHSEYDWDTLLNEYLRDKKAGLEPAVPDHYFPEDDDTQPPVVRWRSCANLLYSNWLNYFVYQSTPYDISTISREDLAPALQERADLKVAKFGGTSLATAAQFRKVAGILREDPARRYIVVSAPGKRRKDDVKITDMLIECAGNPELMDQRFIDITSRFREIVRGLKLSFDLDAEMEKIRRDYEQDGSDAFLISRGEYLCARIMAEYVGADFVDAAELILFDGQGNFLEKESRRRIAEVLSGHERAVIPGFYGSGPDGRIVTFPRGGSDITGAAVSAGVTADIYENWTDVSGLLMADPKVVKNPLPVPVITYKELRELAFMGAEVMHEDVVFPVRKMGIPINIRNTNRPQDPGTLIVKNADYYPSLLKISGISGGTGYASIVVEKERLNEDEALRTTVMRIFGEQRIPILNILTGVDSLNIFVNEKDIRGHVRELTAQIRSAVNADKVTAATGIAMIAVVSRFMSSSPAIGAKVLTALASRRINVRMIDYGVEGISTLVGIDEGDYENGVRAIYTEFIKK